MIILIYRIAPKDERKTSMLKRAVWVFILVFGLATTAFAQESEPREIYTVLGYGDGVFEASSWLATAYEQYDRTTAYWTSTEISAIAYIDLLHYTSGFTVDEAFRFFGDIENWLEGVLVNYQPWTMTARCGAGDLMLYEFDGVFENQPRLIRYWFQVTEPDRLLTAQLIFTTEDRDLLDSYAEQMFPRLPSCG
jgi:hypothetical protein